MADTIGKAPVRIEVDPAPSFVLAVGSAQALAATVLDRNRTVIEDAEVEWHVVPPGVGRILLDGERPFFVAGQRPGLATIHASCGDLMSERVEIQVWPREGVRVGFREIGGAYPLVAPPAPRKLRPRPQEHGESPLLSHAD